MNLEEVVQYRRSVRVYDQEQPLDTEKVKHCLELAALAPNSSNMQLWEAYHVTNSQLIQKMAVACMDQTTVSTAPELVVFVTRQDWYRKHAKAVLNFERGNIKRNSPEHRQQSRITYWEQYYGKLMPFFYARFFGVLGGIRKLVVGVVGLFRPIVRQVSESDVRVVLHKSCGLVAQTFMIAMANEGYDTCPIEGFDSRRIKKMLRLPSGSEINMVVSCGIRKGEEGIRGERFRVPFEEVYKRVE